MTRLAELWRWLDQKLSASIVLFVIVGPLFMYIVVSDYWEEIARLEDRKITQEFIAEARVASQNAAIPAEEFRQSRAQTTAILEGLGTISKNQERLAAAMETDTKAMTNVEKHLRRLASQPLYGKPASNLLQCTERKVTWKREGDQVVVFTDVVPVPCKRASKTTRKK